MATIVRETLPVVDAISDLIEDQHVSNREVARRLGVAPGTVGNWLDAKTVPDWRDDRLRRRISILLGVSPLRVLELFGVDTSDEAPAPPDDSGSVHDLGPYLEEVA